MRRRRGVRMLHVTAVLPVGIVAEMDKLIEKGLFRNRNDLIREAIRQLILKYRSLDKTPIEALG